MIPVHTVNRATCEQSFHEFRRGRTLGSGSYGTVYELCDPQNVCPYALKVQELPPQIIERNRVTYQAALIAEIMKEVEAQIRVHERLGITPAIYDYWICRPSRNRPDLRSFIVMERIHGDLEGYIRKYPRRLTTRFIREMDERVARWVRDIHRIGIAHRDIHAKNILYKVEPDGHVRWYLGDWGYARPLNANGLARDAALPRQMIRRLYDIQARQNWVR